MDLDMDMNMDMVMDMDIGHMDMGRFPYAGCDNIVSILTGIIKINTEFTGLLKVLSSEN
jgi:hypothetical protein